MKTLNFLTLFLITVGLHAQIDEGLGVIEFEECDFEDDCGRVVLDTSITSIWQIGEPDKAVFDTAYSPTHCIVTDTALTYPTSNHSFFDYTVYPSDGGGLYNYILGFKHRFDSDSLIDGGYIEFRYDSEGEWSNVSEHQYLYPEIDFFTENLYGDADTLAGGINGFSGFSNEWVYTRIQWIWVYPIREVFDTLHLRFNFISDSLDTERDGWMIDDFSLSVIDVGGSVDEYGLDNSRLEVFPNPSLGETTVKYENHQNEKYSLSVINLVGQEVVSMKGLSGSTVALDTQKLPKGIYDVQVLQDGKITAHQKLVVQ